MKELEDQPKTSKKSKNKRKKSGKNLTSISEPAQPEIVEPVTQEIEKTSDKPETLNNIKEQPPTVEMQELSVESEKPTKVFSIFDSPELEPRNEQNSKQNDNNDVISGPGRPNNNNLEEISKFCCQIFYKSKRDKDLLKLFNLAILPEHEDLKVLTKPEKSPETTSSNNNLPPPGFGMPPGLSNTNSNKDKDSSSAQPPSSTPAKPLSYSELILNKLKNLYPKKSPVVLKMRIKKFRNEIGEEMFMERSVKDHVTYFCNELDLELARDMSKIEETLRNKSKEVDTDVESSRPLGPIGSRISKDYEDGDHRRHSKEFHSPPTTRYPLLDCFNQPVDSLISPNSDKTTTTSANLDTTDSSFTNFMSPTTHRKHSKDISSSHNWPASSSTSDEKIDLNNNLVSSGGIKNTSRHSISGPILTSSNLFINKEPKRTKLNSSFHTNKNNSIDSKTMTNVWGKKNPLEGVKTSNSFPASMIDDAWGVRG